MEKIIIYGKGGIGKSFIATNLSLSCAKVGLRVLHIGCDPKHDSSISLSNGKKLTTVIDLIKDRGRKSLKKEDIIAKGLRGVDCIEAGGPESGVGCAGHGISLLFEVLTDLDIINENDYDVVIYDVLGDVVCGGFASPLKLKFGKKIVIVVSEELMSLYAANNICKAIKHYEYNGVYLCGLILNQRDNKVSLDHLKRFAKEINTGFLGRIPRSKLVAIAEYKKRPVIDVFPKSRFTNLFSEIGERILYSKEEDCKKVEPIDDIFSPHVFDKIFLQKDKYGQ